MKKDNEKLGTKDIASISAESLLQLVPVVGASLATAYFSYKNEKRFKRLESFYKELSNKIQDTSICSYSEHDEESLINLIEKINYQIESEASKEKVALFQSYFLGLLTSPTTTRNYDERLLILNTLSAISFLEFQLLISYHHRSRLDISNAYREGANSHLESLGLLRATYQAETRLGSSPVKIAISISDYGEEFIKFIENHK